MGPMSARDGAVYLVRCVEHGREYAGENGWGNTMRNIRDFRGIVSLSPCSDACTHAQGGDCRCSCGGIHHGEES